MSDQHPNGRNRQVIEEEFLFGGATPYEIFTNSGASDACGVLIAIKICANIQVVDFIKYLYLKHSQTER